MKANTSPKDKKNICHRIPWDELEAILNMYAEDMNRHVTQVLTIDGDDVMVIAKLSPIHNF